MESYLFFNVEEFLKQIELNIEISELKKIGLTDEEIAGYIEFFYFGGKNDENCDRDRKKDV